MCAVTKLLTSMLIHVTRITHDNYKLIDHIIMLLNYLSKMNGIDAPSRYRQKKQKAASQSEALTSTDQILHQDFVHSQ